MEGCNLVISIDLTDNIQLPDEKQYQYIFFFKESEEDLMEKWLDKDILNPILNLNR